MRGSRARLSRVDSRKSEAAKNFEARRVGRRYVAVAVGWMFNPFKTSQTDQLCRILGNCRFHLHVDHLVFE